MKLHLTLFIGLLFLIFSTRSRAQLFQIKVIDYGGIENSAILKSLVDQKLQEFENLANEENPYAGPERIMEGTADSSVMAAKGIGKDYASYMSLYLIGLSAGVGLDRYADNGTDSDISGIGAATGLVAGTTAKNLNIQNFAGLDTNKLSLYANFMKFGHDYELKDSQGVESDLRVDLLNLGFHFKYDWIEGKGDPQLGWGGFKLHWGYEYNRNKFIYVDNLDLVFGVTDGQDNINGRVTAKPKYEIISETHSIPLEISTDGRFFNFFTLYGGLGTDINYGKAKGSAIADGDVTPLICTGTGVCGGTNLIRIQVQGTADAEGRVSPLFLRGFTGLQFNLPYIRIFAQADKAFGTELIALSTGLKFVY